MGIWIKLSGGLYLFGEDGVTRVEEYTAHMSNGQESPYKSGIYNKTSLITVVRETVEEIEEKLNGRQ